MKGTENLIFVTGPSGCGKTTNAKKLCEYFECTHYLEGVDSVYDYSEFPTKVLILTCVPAEKVKSQFSDSTVVDFYKACHDARLTTLPQENYNISPEILMRMLKGAWSAGYSTSRYSPNIGFVAECDSKEIIKNFIGDK